ncbi:MAG: glyoxylate reductase [Desulfurococcales archaeon]|jgi:glyoxylate reductase
MSKRPRVYITREIFSEALERLSSVYDYDVWDKCQPPPYEKLREKLREFDAVLSMVGDRIDCEIIKTASHRLRIIANMAVGYDNIDVRCATQHSIYVTNTPDVLTEATADLAFALLLAVARRIVEGDHFVRWGEWWRSGTAFHPRMLLGVELYGKTLGIIGMGRIGKAVARRARGFGLKIIYYSRRRLSEKEERELGAEYVDLDTLLARSDFISIHVPLTEETRHMIDEKKLRIVKRGAIIINTSRGAVIDNNALVKALEEGWIAGAGLDVYEEEPLNPNHPLTRFKNVVLTPHIGSATKETRLAMAMLAVENLIAFAMGKEPPNLVNREVLAVRPPGFTY